MTFFSNLEEYLFPSSDDIFIDSEKNNISLLKINNFSEASALDCSTELGGVLYCLKVNSTAHYGAAASSTLSSQLINYFN